MRLRAGRYSTWRAGIGLPRVYRDAGTGRVMGVFATFYGRAFYVEWRPW